MYDPTRPKVTMTPGRTLFTCSPIQFEQFTDNNSLFPRAGLLRQAMQELGFALTQEANGLWYVHDAEGLRCVEAEPNERRATQVWWLKVGRTKTSQYRNETRMWLAMNRPGRPSLDAEEFEDNSPSRTAKRNEAFSVLTDLWDQMGKLLVSHSAQAEVWVHLSLNRALPRPHCVQKVGERRALVHALRHLFDLDRLNPAIHESLNGEIASDDELAEAIGLEYTKLTCEGDAAGLVPRTALQVALQLSPRSAREFFEDIHDIMARFNLATTDALEEQCKVAIT